MHDVKEVNSKRSDLALEAEGNFVSFLPITVVTSRKRSTGSRPHSPTIPKQFAQSHKITVLEL